MRLTDTDKALLELLRNDSRRTTSEMAEILGVSRTTVNNRIDRLKAKGVIRRFTVDMDLSEVEAPYGIRAVFALHLRRPVCYQLYDFVKDWPELSACWSISGSLDMLIMVEAANQMEIERLRDKLARHNEVDTVITSMILKTWAERISGVREDTPEGYRIVNLNKDCLTDEGSLKNGISRRAAAS